jgi:hypothetical protein
MRSIERRIAAGLNPDVRLFFFAGIIRELADGEVLRLQYLNDADLDLNRRRSRRISAGSSSSTPTAPGPLIRPVEGCPGRGAPEPCGGWMVRA